MVCFIWTYLLSKLDSDTWWHGNPFWTVGPPVNISDKVVTILPSLVLIITTDCFKIHKYYIVPPTIQ